MVVVEFLGFSGSGKTTFANEVARRLQPTNHLVHTRNADLADDSPVFFRHFIRARYVLHSVLRNPEPFIAALRLIRQDRQPNVRIFAKVCWNLWCVLGWYGWLARRSGRGVAIVDQGVIQAILSVRLSALSDSADWSGFLQRFNMIDGVVVLGCNQKALQERLTARTEQISRLSHVSDINPLWQLAQRAYEQGCNEASCIAPLLQLTNESPEDLNAGVAKAISWLNLIIESESSNNGKNDFGW